MRYVLATDKLVVQGRCYKGFPLLVNEGGDAMQPAQSFLWDVIAKGARVSSPKTWDVYGRALYDFFAYVYTKKLDWKNPAAPGMPGAIEAYRDWSKGTVGLENSTINNRLRVVARFYEWAVRKGHIDHVPFDRVTVQTSRQPGFLAHVDATGGKVQSPEILLQQKARAIKILTSEQIPICYDALPPCRANTFGRRGR